MVTHLSCILWSASASKEVHLKLLPFVNFYLDDGIKSGGLGEQRAEICHFKTICPPDQIVSAYVYKIKSEIDFPELGLNCLLASYHTSYLSRTPRTCPCNFFLAVSPCLANKVPKPQPTPPRNTPRSFLQAYISWMDSAHNHNQNMNIYKYVQRNSPERFVHEGIGKC